MRRDQGSWVVLCRAMLLEHALYLAVCSTVGGLYFTGFCTQLSFFMIIL